MRSKNNHLPDTVSLDALEQVDFQQYWLIAKRRWQPTVGVFAAIMVLTSFGASLQKPSYTASGKLLVRANRLPTLTGLGSESAGRISNLTMQSNPLRTEAESILSHPILERTIAALKLTDNQGKPIAPDALGKQIKVKDVSGADVLRITYENRDAEHAAELINQLMREYLQSNILENRSEAAAAREFIVQQLPKTEVTVRQAEIALRQFKERSGIADLEREEELLTDALGKIESQITDVRTDLSALNTRFETLQSKLQMDAQQALDISTLSQSPGVQQVLTQLQQIQVQLELERTRYQEVHPEIVSLLSKESSLKDLLQQRMSDTIGAQTVTQQDLTPGEIKQGLIKDFVNAEVERLSLASRLSALGVARDTYQQRVSAVPRLEQEQRELQRTLGAAQSTYESLLKRLQEVQLTERQTVGTARIIESATIPTQPSGSKKNIIFMLGTVLATLLSLGTVTFLELRDRSIKSTKEAREFFGYTWLGTIPFFGKSTHARSRRQEWTIPDLPVRDAPRSMTSASYRMLQANLKFLSLDDRLKSIVITSSVPKEGKSTIAANLSATLAQLGRRTLLIDADMHHPSQHHIWNLTNAQGLSDVIVGQSSVDSTVIPVAENLDVLTCGVIPPNPLALLDSKRTLSLIESFARGYDFVIVDAPPLVVEAEALTLGKIMDGILLVVRPGVVDFASATVAKELLQQSSQNVLGMVINSAILETEAHRSGYYDRDYQSQETAIKAS
jgi:polysaccharide biosynthesis transport protein